MEQKKKPDIGARSFRAPVKLRPDKPCNFAKHFLGGRARLMHRLEFLAGQNEYRFVFESPENLQRHSPRWKGAQYDRRKIFLWLAEFKAKRIIRWAVVNFEGRDRKGYIVAVHQDVCTTRDGFCIFDAEQLSFSFSEGTKPHPEGTGEGTQRSPEGTAEGTKFDPEGTGKDLEGTDQGSAEGTEKSALSSTSPETSERQQQAISQAKSQADLTVKSFEVIEVRKEKSGKEDSEVRERAEIKTETLSPTSENLFDLDLKPKTSGRARRVQTIGDVMGGADTISEVLRAVSDGVFDEEIFEKENYGHTELLIESCRRAVRELAGDPFRGRKSFERVMRRAMDILKREHGQNAPKGWLAVIHKLEAGGDSSETEHKCGHEPEIIIPVEQVLSHDYSAIPNADRELAAVLQTEADARPALKAAAIEAARRLGTPMCWTAALKYCDELAAELGNQGEAIPTSLVAMRAKLVERGAR